MRTSDLYAPALLLPLLYVLASLPQGDGDRRNFKRLYDVADSMGIRITDGGVMRNGDTLFVSHDDHVFQYYLYADSIIVANYLDQDARIRSGFIPFGQIALVNINDPGRIYCLWSFNYRIDSVKWQERLAYLWTYHGDSAQVIRLTASCEFVERSTYRDRTDSSRR